MLSLACSEARSLSWIEIFGLDRPARQGPSAHGTGDNSRLAVFAGASC